MLAQFELYLLSRCNNAILMLTGHTMTAPMAQVAPFFTLSILNSVWLRVVMPKMGPLSPCQPRFPSNRIMASTMFGVRLPSIATFNCLQVQRVSFS